MKYPKVSRSSITINNIWKARGRRPTLRRSCKVFIPRDLRHLDMLRVPASYEEDSIIVQKLKAVTRHKLHHWLLILSISFYLYFGAVMFQYIESHYGLVRHFNLSEPREEILFKITENLTSNVSPEEAEEWFKMARLSLSIYEREVINAAKDGYKGDVADGQRPQWNLQESILFCVTAITTIGYGNIAPSTDAGRAATIIYAFLGIPLMLMVLADLGKLFTKAIKYVFRYLRRFYKSGTFSKKKAAAALSDNKPLQYMTVSWRTVSHKPNTTEKLVNDDGLNQVTTLTLHNDDLYKNLDFMNPDETNHKHVEVEDEFNLPVSLAIALVLVYMVVGAMLFAIWEEWSFFESFYFVFISMSTVGFGDYVPSNQSYMMGAFAYLVLGLTLTSMCINVIQEKLSATFQKAKVRIGNTIGLDVNTLLRDEEKRSRSAKRELSQSLHKTRSESNISSPPSTPVSLLDHRKNSLGSLDNSNIKNDINNIKNDIFLNVPLQKRFTFYDSPYSTIQNDSTYNTVTSLNSLNARF